MRASSPFYEVTYSVTASLFGHMQHVPSSFFEARTLLQLSVFFTFLVMVTGKAWQGLARLVPLFPYPANTTNTLYLQAFLLN